MAVIEGVDYSKTANADWAGLANAIKANGNHFVGRYAVNDKSPAGRGISGEEYAAMKAAGLGVFLYWESSEGWMTGGYAAGVAAAQNAQANLVAAGIPQSAPVYFACDFDATPEQQVPIDACLKGAASVLGPDRVGIYGGYWIVSRCAANGTAKWFAQTSAWSYDPSDPSKTLWFEGNHLEQYNYNRMIAGTNCDDVRALKDNYGQATPPPPPKPDVIPPTKFAKPEKLPALGPNVLPYKHELTVKTAYTPRSVASNGGKPTGADIAPGTVIQPTRLIIADDGSLWVTTKGGSRHPWSAFTH